MVEPELADTFAATPPASDALQATLTAAPRSTPGRVVPTAGSLATGHQLGHFRIERLLGAGGMGEVYLATDLSLDRSVAIKVLPEHVAQDPLRRDRMVREARAQARVVHPNVGHLYFIGEDSGRLYFAMEYVAGETLGERVAAGPLPIEAALAMIRGAALGLREAQRSGFTHRDVKPSNLMIDGHGMVKVLDFGLAAGDPGGSEQGPVAQTSRAGTPLYMAPEQARGDAVDSRADIYALGATFYHLVTGHPPFEADSLDLLVSMHATSARPLIRRRGIPRRLALTVDALVGRMMAQDPDDRFATYDDLVRALDLASVTQSRPAGGTIRAIAGTVDLLLISIVGALCMLLVSLLTGGDVAIPSTLILLLYAGYAVLTTRRLGATLGQLLFELEILDYTTAARPRVRSLSIRAVATIAMPLLSIAPTEIGSFFGYEPTTLGDVLRILALLANVIAIIWAAGWSAGKRTPWDRLSHTLMRYRS